MRSKPKIPIAETVKSADICGVGDGPAFSTLFRIALLALGLSKARAASLLQVDKSLVGRWASGAVRPTEHNLSRISALVAEHVPQFSMQDWQRDARSFSELMGVDPNLAQRSVQPPAAVGGGTLNCVTEAHTETEKRGAAYEGFWRTTRPSVLMNGRVFHDYGMIRRGDTGLLEVTMGGAGLAFNGWALPLEGNLFVMLDGAVGFTPLFLIFRGVTLPKVTRLDGIVLLAALDAARTPAAMPILLERVADLTGDRVDDDRRCTEMSTNDPFEDEADISDELRAHLFRDVGPEAAARGGEMFLMVSAANMFSRGTTPPGQLEG
ncbi:helix-turn-helix transcriptional regulator [Croceicoccus bisphenolivorans]|uniref:helix-turn-helix transcriptional regulator n=1 Tax=Croceicoccus bisphenolivorans TaxID=1783232 RepID=UPI000836CAE1|nr:helix-turn-helix transcriptional regulator [Croceicoccus bisphenolivorans]